MEQIASVEYFDLEHKDQAWFFVRRDDESICLSFAVKMNGDIDLAMSPPDAQRLVEALVAALSKRV